MKSKIKIVFMFLLIAVFTVSSSSFAFANTNSLSESKLIDSGTCGTNIIWKLTEDGILNISGTGDMTEWTNSTHIPWRNYQELIKTVVIEQGVTSIGFCAFSDLKNVTSIEIPNTITKIEQNAFERCERLKHIVLPDSVIQIGNEAFSFCNGLECVVLPNKLSRIENKTFQNCIKLINVDIPNTVSYIGGRAFQYCSSITSIKLPDELETLDTDAFFGCTALENVIMSENVKSALKDLEKYFIGTKYILKNKDIKGSCGSSVLWSLNENGVLNITGTGEMNYSTTSPPWDDYDGLVQTVIIHEGVTSIGKSAFYGCVNLGKIIVATTVKEMGATLFGDCNNLNVIFKGDGVSASEVVFHTVRKTDNIKMFYPENGWKGMTPIGDYGIAYMNEVEWIPYCVLDNEYNVLGHTAGAEATCTTDQVCTTCNVVLNIATGHDYESKVTTPATCIKEGVMTYTCKNDNTHTYTDAIPATGHSYSSYKTTKKAGFGTKGIQTSTCQNANCIESKTKSIPALKTPTLSTTTYTFNNKVKKPTATVKNTAGTKVKSTVAYATGRKAVGKYAVKVKVNTANYEGTKTVYFKINPKGATNVKLISGKKQFTVKWAKPNAIYKKQITGYEVKYALTSAKLKTAKPVVVKGNSVTNKTIKNLKAKKKYFVQVRSYKTVKGVKYYSDWSAKKTVTTK